MVAQPAAGRSALYNGPRRTQRFGNKATISTLPNPIVEGEHGKEVNPIYVSHMKDELISKILFTLDRWGGNQGGNGEAVKLAAPVVSIHLDDRRIYLDMIAEVVPADVGLRWYVEDFHIAAFRNNISKAIDLACKWFADRDWNRQAIANDQSISEARAS